MGAWGFGFRFPALGFRVWGLELRIGWEGLGYITVANRLREALFGFRDRSFDKPLLA